MINKGAWLGPPNGGAYKEIKKLVEILERNRMNHKQGSQSVTQDSCNERPSYSHIEQLRGRLEYNIKEAAKLQQMIKMCEENPAISRYFELEYNN